MALIERYEKQDQVLIVDFRENGQVYYRQFEQGNYTGAYRKDEDDFRQSLKRWLLGAAEAVMEDEKDGA